MNNSTNKLVPALRFPEFLKDGEWKSEILNNEDIAEFINEKVTLQKLNKGIYISTENILPDFGGVKLSIKLPTSGSFTKFSEGDILVSNIRPYLRKIWFSNTNGAASNDVIVIRAGRKIDKVFLSYHLKNDNFINYIMKGAEGVKMPRGDKDSIKEYNISFPKLTEQQKIAACLSSLDGIIAAHSQKLDALKEHKKGLMQNLFPQEGETVPKLRFSEFEEDGDWVEKKLGEIFNISAGGDVDKENVSEVKTDVFKYHIYANAEKKKGLYGYSNIYKVDENVITVAGRGVNIGIAHARNHKFYPIVRLLVLKPLNNENVYFFEYLINKLELHGESTGVPQLTAPQISLYKVVFPSPPEQQKIASCLAALDELITAQADKIAQLKLHKKGLMQELFPKIND